MKDKKTSFFKSRRFKHGSLSMIITIGFLVALLIVNVISTLLLKRFPLTIDLSKDNRFGITTESVDYIKTIKDDVTIYVCVKESDFEAANEMYKQAYEVITSYSKHNAKIKVEFIDLIKSPTFAQKYPNETLNTADIIVESANRYKKFRSYDLFIEKQLENGSQISSKAEQVMTSALMYVMDENPSKAILLSTGDNKLDAYVELLKSNNFDIIEQDLLTEELDKDATMVVMPPLKADLTAEQIKKLDVFLSNDDAFGKTLMYVAGQDTPNFPNIDEFLAEWGIRVQPGIIMETDPNNAVSDLMTVVNTMDYEAMNKDLKDPTKPYVTPYSHPVERIFEASGNRKTESLAKTADTSIAVPPSAGEDYDPAKETKQSYDTIVLGMKQKYEGTTLQQANVVVYGSEYAMESTFLQYQGFNNGDYMANIATKCANKKDGVSIVPIDFSQETIAITPAQKSGFTLFFMIILPLATLICGIVVWLRRRYR